MKTITSLDQNEAQALIESAMAKAKDIQVPVCIAVVDAAAELVAFIRMDGAKYHSTNVAIDKAYTAASSRSATADLAPRAQPGKPLFGIHTQQGGRFCIVGGGLPLMHDGQCIGGVGVSSGTVDQDIEIATAALSALS